MDKAVWEFLAYQLAIDAGIVMAQCRLEKISGRYLTFFICSDFKPLYADGLTEFQFGKTGR